MTNWFTSDTHFYHFNIIRYTGRPFISHELQAIYNKGHKPCSDEARYAEAKCLKYMNETLINNWNEKVKPDDTVYHLGDLCFPKRWNVDILIEALHGKIVLILGNHDKQKTKQAFMRHPEKCSYHTSLEMQIGKYKCLLNHRPVYPEGPPDPLHDHAKGIDMKKYDFIINGHVHNHWKIHGKCINVSVDVTNFSPISESVLENVLCGASR